MKVKYLNLHNPRPVQIYNESFIIVITETVQEINRREKSKFVRYLRETMKNMKEPIQNQILFTQF